MAATALPPGPRMPRTLQTIGWINRTGPFLSRCRDRYGDTFTLKIANEGNWVMLSDPEHVKHVFTGDPEVFHAGEGNRILLPLLGPNSVLLLDEGPHLRQRKLLLPSFHGERIARYEGLLRGIVADELREWPRGTSVAMWPRMQAITLELIVRAVFGVREADRLDRLRAALRSMLDLTTRPPVMLGLALLGPERMGSLRVLRRQVDPVDELVLDEIRRRRDDPTAAERDDVLSLLVQARHEDGSPMSDDELRDELVTLLVAGHETTATALAWALERLVRHPDLLERLTAEVEAGEDDWLDAVVKETLRLRPVLAIVARRLTQPVEIGGWRLPAGATVTPSIWLMHRRADIYPDPHAFRPERFLEQPAGTYTWIPFGGGVRRCLGASFALFEMKTVLAEIVRSAVLRPVRPDGERVRRRAITLTPDRGAEVLVGA